MDYDTWAEWLANNTDADEATKLTTLREYIFGTARDQKVRGEITAEWANKKLAKLGITERISATNTYVMEAPATGMVQVTVRGNDRAAAAAEFRRLTDRAQSLYAENATVDYTQPVFVSGPEDSDPTVVDPSAPTTVDGTLVVLREIIMLGNVSGPRWDCETGVNRVLAAYGLPLLPGQKAFTVSVPVEGVMKTTVTAYDEATAQRVAGWRWDNDRTGYDMDHVRDTDVATVTALPGHATF